MMIGREYAGPLLVDIRAGTILGWEVDGGLVQFRKSSVSLLSEPSGLPGVYISITCLKAQVSSGC